MAPSATILAANALRSLLEAIVMQAGLDEHAVSVLTSDPDDIRKVALGKPVNVVSL